VRLGLYTLATLKNCGDEEARLAFKAWVRLSSYIDPPVTVAAWWVAETNTIEVGLTWLD